MKLLDRLENDDDVQNVYSNFDIDDELIRMTLINEILSFNSELKTCCITASQLAETAEKALAEAKKKTGNENLTIEDLMKLFTEASGSEFTSDKGILSK